jgi:N6-L-threonylcarbamoyladenine synthase
LSFTRTQPFFPNIIMGLETSCDETSVSLLREGRSILSNRIASQDDLHSRYGGVVPEIACRRHLEVIHPLIEEALAEAQLSFGDIDAVAVTHGPGLIGAVLVGLAVAKTLALLLDRPLLGVNHLEGHLYSPLLEHPDLEPPWVSLLVSGGHTMLVHVPEWGAPVTLGKTRDDAAGEAFDKVAKQLGLGYPGGPRVGQRALQGNPKAVNLPRPMLGQGFEFSFSGLKTAVHYARAAQPDLAVDDVCASFQEAVVDVLIHKTMAAADQLGVDRISLAGGVAANLRLRQRLEEVCQRRGRTLFVPSAILCTDNAAMIARAGWQLAQLGIRSELDLDAHANLPLRNWKAFP